MAVVAQLDQAQMQEAAQEYYNFLETFRALGVGSSLTVTDVFLRITETGLPTGYIGPYMENTDPTTTEATGKTNLHLNI